MNASIDRNAARVRNEPQQRQAHRSEHRLAALRASGLSVLLVMAGWTPAAHAALSETVAILNPTPDNADGFGVDVAIDGDLAIVGAWHERTNAANANPINNAGAAYIYQRSNGAWALVQKLVPSDRHANQGFGIAVAISGGHTALIGSGGGFTNGVQNAGAAYFFVKGGNGVWQQAQKVNAPTPEVGANFGGNSGMVALDAAGDTAVIGSWREPAGGPLRQSGAAYVYRRQGFTAWQMVQRIAPQYPEKDGHFGAAVAVRNDHIMIGAPDEDLDPNTAQLIASSGSVYHFSNTGTSLSPNWQMAQKIFASDRNAGDAFGRALAFSGNLLVVGSAGNSRDTNGNGPVLSKAGAAYVFNPTAPGYTAWTQTQKLTIPAPHRTAGDYFGTSVALDKNTRYLVVGASAERHNLDEVSNPIPFTGSAYVYQLTGGQPWTASFVQKLVPSDRSYGQVFGYRVGVTTDNLSGAPAVLIGSYKFIMPASPPNPSIPSVGKVYFFE